MDFRSHVVPALLVGTFMLLLLYGFSWLSDSSSRLERQLASAPRRQPRAPATAARSALQPRPNNSVRVSQLRELLVSRTAELNERTAVLNRKTTEYDELKREFDKLNQEFEAAAVHLQELILAEGQDAGSKANPDLPQMQEALAESKTQLAAREMQLDELRSELLAANEEIVQLQIDAEMAISQLLDERDAATEVQAAATDALLRTGAPAVAALTQQLETGDPEVRRWAAATLGRLGADAQSAIPALLQALSDREQRVRLAARDALESIDAASQ